MATPSWKGNDSSSSNVPGLASHQEWPEMSDKARICNGLGCCVCALVFSECTIGTASKSSCLCFNWQFDLCTTKGCFKCWCGSLDRKGVLDCCTLSLQSFCLDLRWSLFCGNDTVPCIISLLGCTCCYNYNYVGCQGSDLFRGFMPTIEKIKSFAPTTK